MKKLLIGLCAVCFAATMSTGMLLTASASDTLGTTTVDFTTDDGTFEAYLNGGWTVDGGKYKPAAAGAITKSAKELDVTGTTYVSFDFYAASAPFDFVLLSDIASAWSGGLGFHLYAECVTVNNNLDRNGWIGDCSAFSGALVDGQVHNLKMKIADGKASFYVDGATEAVSFNGGALTEIDLVATEGENARSLSDSAQLIFRAADTTSYIDNFKVSDSDIPYVAPEQPATPEEKLTSASLDFTTDDGGTFTGHNGDGWTVDDGKYKPTAASAITKTAKKLDVTGTTYVSFDFFATSAPFDFVLLSDIDNGWSGGLGFHLYSDAITVNNNVDRNGWIGDCTAYTSSLVDGQVHTLKMKIADGKASFYVDGATEAVSFNGGALTEIDLVATEGENARSLSDSAQLIFRAADTTSYIDNFKVSDSDIPYVAPEQPEQPEEKLTSADLDFTTDDGGTFTGHNGDGWVVSGGKYIPTAASAIAKTAKKLDVTGTVYVSFDFYATRAPFDFVLLPNIDKGWGGGLGFHLYADCVVVNNNLDRNGWIGDCGNYAGALVDEQAHNLKMKIADGKASFYVDGATEAVSFNNDTLTEIDLVATGGDNARSLSNSAQIIFRAADTTSYIDNFKVSDTDIPYVAPEQPADLAEKLTSADLDFATDDGGVFTAHSGGGWVVDDGKYRPAAAGAITKSSKKLDITGSTYVSFDFCATSAPFDFVLLPNINVAWYGGLGFHLYDECVTVNNNLDRNGWIGDCTVFPDALADGKVHNLLIKIVDGKASFYVDGAAEAVSFNVNGGTLTEIDLVATGEENERNLSKSAQIIFRAADTTSYIDNFKVLDSDPTYIPPPADETYEVTTPAQEEPTVELPEGTTTTFNKVFLTLAIVCGAVALVGVAVIVVIVVKRKNEIE